MRQRLGPKDKRFCKKVKENEEGMKEGRKSSNDILSPNK
jgi:hypothetical protein